MLGVNRKCECKAPLSQPSRLVVLQHFISFDRSQSTSASSDFVALYEWFCLLTYFIAHPRYASSTSAVRGAATFIGQSTLRPGSSTRHRRHRACRVPRTRLRLFEVHDYRTMKHADCIIQLYAIHIIFKLGSCHGLRYSWTPSVTSLQLD